MKLNVKPRQSYQTHRTVLENGIVILVVENPAADIIASRIFMRSGSRREQKAGLAHLVASVMTKGTDKLSSLEIAEKVESVGASVGADAAADYFLVSLKTVSADFAEILALVGEILRSPSFPEGEVELEKRITMQGIRSQQEQPFAVAFKALREAMYQQHPYGRSPLGTEESVSSIKRQDMQEFHSTYFRPDNMVISISGRIDPSDAIALVKDVFGDWQAPDMPIPEASQITITGEPHQIVTAQETQQSVIMIGYLAASVHSQDYAHLKLLNTYLGNGLSSRLFVELREKRGLAYDVSAMYPTRQETANFVVYMGTAPRNTAIAKEGLQSEVERLRNVQLTPEELQACKNKLLGQYALGKQTNSQISQVLGWYETMGLGVEFDVQFQEDIASVTSEAAQAVANRYFTAPYISLVGPGDVVDFC
ncbi:MAG: insulinase family protein [Hormoscilla sp. GUM202]|nr:insulinase family protein [Hormoscilla sp. GUM202]